MATSIKLKGDIKKIEAAIKSKATPKTLVPKLEAQLDKLKSDLASLSSAKPKKGVTKTKVLSSLQKLKAKVKATKSLSGYKKSGIDIKKDAEIPARALGRRVSKGLKANGSGTKAQNKGNVYYEYRLNRADVKQPPKRYPKLEDGGMMEKGGEGSNLWVIYTKEWQKKPEIIEEFTATHKTAKNKLTKLQRSKPNSDVVYLMTDKISFYELYGDLMAMGGKISDKQMQRLDSGFEFIIYTDLPRQYGQYHISMAKEKGDVVYIVKSGHVADSKKVKTFTSEKDAFDYLTNKFGVKVSRKKMNYEDGGMMAKGGITEHGLKIGDKIIDFGENGKMLYITNDNKMFSVNIERGARVALNIDGGMMADKKFAVYAFDGKTNFFLDNEGNKSRVNYPSDIMSFDTTQEAIDFVKKHQYKYTYPLTWTTSPNLENTYSELNRDLEVYPISMMAEGGRTTSAINRDRAYKSNQPWEQSYSRKSNPKNPKYKSSSDFFEGGGEMHRLFEDGEV